MKVAKIAKESWIILAIGLIDLITTIIFIRYYEAEEANPLFRRYWEMGLVVFIAAKALLLIGPLSILEWARKRNPVFVSWALRGVIVAYLGMYGVGVLRLNHTDAVAETPTRFYAKALIPGWTRHLEHARAVRAGMLHMGVRPIGPITPPAAIPPGITDGNARAFPFPARGDMRNVSLNASAFHSVTPDQLPTY